DPGVVYVIRSPAHDKDVYKIGLTRRNPAERAAEIGAATGVPLPFGVLANWTVRDCGSVEKKVHARLRQFRLSKRREFFRADLGDIVTAVQAVVGEESHAKEAP